MPELIDVIHQTAVYPFPCDFSNVEDFLEELEMQFFQDLWADWLHTNDEEALWEVILDSEGPKLREYYHFHCR